MQLGTDEIRAVMTAPAARAARSAPGWPDGAGLVEAGGLAAVLVAQGSRAALAAGRIGRALRPTRAALAGLAADQALLERLLDAGDVLAATRGPALGKDGARALLLAERARLADALAAHAGAVQYRVEIRWDPGAALARFRTSPELAGLGLAPGRSVPAARLAAAGEALARRLAGEFEATVAAAARDILRMPRDGIETLANLAVMLQRAELCGLEAALERIDAVWPEGLRIRLIGPLPVLSFAALDLRLASAGEIRAACRRLGLAGPDDDPDAGFRARARAWHPDAGGAVSGVDFASLRAARDLLREVGAARARLAAAGLPARQASLMLLRIRREDGAPALSGPMESAA